MDNITLASPLGAKEHLAAWDQLFEYRFAALELDKLLIMMVDTVDSKALPYLADQFDLLGVKGWNATKTDQDKRNLIKRAIELKRYQGTPYAIRRALQSVGYYDAEILEGVGALYDGRFMHDGFLTYGGGTWANFAVILDIGETRGISISESTEAMNLINEYKNARSFLVFIDFKCTLIDTVVVSEESALSIAHKFIEGVDPITDNFAFQLVASPMADNLIPPVDSGIQINFINSLGEVTLTENF